MELWSDPVVTRFIGGRPLPREDVWLRLLRYAGSWALLGYGFWLVQDRATGAFVGEVGFHELKRDTKPSFAGTPEVGWGLSPRFQGRGLAREAVEAALAWGDDNIDSDRTVCIIHPENTVSLRLAQHFGFEPQMDVVYKGGTMTLFERRRPSRAETACRGLLPSADDSARPEGHRVRLGGARDAQSRTETTTRVPGRTR
jgi:RimJ/RimL family protein N-acetyltransferase